MKEEKILRKVLVDNQSKITYARLLVFNLLLHQEPQSIAELAKRAQGQVDRVSVYRIIELYEKLGIAKRINIGWKYKIELSEIFLDHHHHLACLGCNKVVAVKENKAVEQTINELGRGTGFMISSHQIELQGYCQKCQKHYKLSTI